MNYLLDAWAAVWPRDCDWRPPHFNGHLPLGGSASEVLTQTFLLTQNPATENAANAEEEISSNRGT